MKLSMLEGEAYLMGVPVSEENGESDWADLIDAVGGENRVMHWHQVHSFGEKKRDDYTTMCAYGGGWVADEVDNFTPNDKWRGMGFRPVLIPLSDDCKTVVPVFSKLESGTQIKSGALFMDGEPVRVPKRPIERGDITAYKENASISLGDSPGKEYTITWIVVGNKLIADRNLLNCISFTDLFKEDIVEDPLPF